MSKFTSLMDTFFVKLLLVSVVANIKKFQQSYTWVTYPIASKTWPPIC